MQVNAPSLVIADSENDTADNETVHVQRRSEAAARMRRMRHARCERMRAAAADAAAVALQALCPCYT